MKVFAAVPILEDETLGFLSLCSQRLQRFAKRGSFVPERNFHITLLYVGETDRIARIASILDEVASVRRPFPFTIDEFGMFGSKGLPTAWVGGASPELSALHDVLSQKLAREGFPFDKKDYRPHITLGRKVDVRSPEDPTLTEMVLADSSHTFTVDRIALFSSEVIQGRRIYRSLHDAGF